MFWLFQLLLFGRISGEGVRSCNHRKNWEIISFLTNHRYFGKCGRIIGCDSVGGSGRPFLINSIQFWASALSSPHIMSSPLNLPYFSKSLIYYSLRTEKTSSVHICSSMFYCSNIITLWTACFEIHNNSTFLYSEIKLITNGYNRLYWCRLSYHCYSVLWMGSFQIVFLVAA